MEQFDSYSENPDFEVFVRFCRERGRLLELRRGESFQRSGARADRLGYILRGGVRYLCCDKSGTEHVVGFGFEGDCAVAYASFLRRAPSCVDIRAIVDSQLCVVDYDEFCRFVERDDHTRLLIRRMDEALFISTYDRLLEFYLYTPEERYVRLTERCPRLLDRLSLREIASLLHIRPESLSRIRRRMLDPDRRR